MSRDDSDPVGAWLADVAPGSGGEIDIQSVVDDTRRVVPDAEHVSLTVRGRKAAFTTLAATSETSAEADRLQYQLSEGPCVDALLESDWYRTGDIGGDHRWPAWGPRAASLGLGSLLSVRLIADGEPFGALNMYAVETGRFADRDEIDLALLWSTHAAVGISAARAVSNLETALASRHLIGVAQGILMERYGLDESASFTLLRRLSSHRNTKVRDLAEEFVRTGELPT